MAGISYTPTNPGWGQNPKYPGYRVPVLGSSTNPKKAVKKTPPRLSPLDALYKRLLGQTRSQKQLEADATRLAGTQLDSSQELVRSESLRLRGEAERRRQTMMNAMLAAAGQNAAMAPQILGGYQSAAKGLGELGQLAAGAVGDAVRADIASQSEALARVGQAGPTIDAAKQQGVEGYVGGFLPASNLAALGANANAGFLGQVAAQRMESVERPWADYEKVISELDDSELSQLAKVESSRPELVGKILDNLMDNQAGVSKSILAIETEKRRIKAENTRIRQAQAELDYKYQVAQANVTNDQDRLALDDWYKHQNVLLSDARNAISQQNANTATTRANTAALNAGPNGEKWKTIGEIQAQAGRSRRDIPRGQSRQKIKNALYLQFSGMLRPEKRAAFKQWVNAWVDSLPLQQKSGSTSAIPAPPSK